MFLLCISYRLLPPARASYLAHVARARSCGMSSSFVSFKTNIVVCNIATQSVLIWSSLGIFINSGKMIKLDNTIKNIPLKETFLQCVYFLLISQHRHSRRDAPTLLVCDTFCHTIRLTVWWTIAPERARQREICWQEADSYTICYINHSLWCGSEMVMYVCVMFKKKRKIPKIFNMSRYYNVGVCSKRSFKLFGDFCAGIKPIGVFCHQACFSLCCQLSSSVTYPSRFRLFALI